MPVTLEKAIERFISESGSGYEIFDEREMVTNRIEGAFTSFASMKTALQAGESSDRAVLFGANSGDQIGSWMSTGVSYPEQQGSVNLSGIDNGNATDIIDAVTVIAGAAPTVPDGGPQNIVDNDGESFAHTYDFLGPRQSSQFALSASFLLTFTGALPLAGIGPWFAVGFYWRNVADTVWMFSGVGVVYRASTAKWYVAHIHSNDVSGGFVATFTEDADHEIAIGSLGSLNYSVVQPTTGSMTGIQGHCIATPALDAEPIAWPSADISGPADSLHYIGVAGRYPASGTVGSMKIRWTNIDAQEST